MAPNVFGYAKLGRRPNLSAARRDPAHPYIPIRAGFARSKKANGVSRLLRVPGPSTVAEAKPQRRRGAGKLVLCACSGGPSCREILPKFEIQNQPLGAQGLAGERSRWTFQESPVLYGVGCDCRTEILSRLVCRSSICWATCGSRLASMRG